MNRGWLILAMALLLVGCSSAPAESTRLAVPAPMEAARRLHPDELSQVQAVTIHDYASGAVKSVDDPKLVRQLTDKLRESRPAPQSSPLGATEFQYMMWLSLEDHRKIHLIMLPANNDLNLVDPMDGSAWQARGLSDVVTPLLPSTDQDKKYIGRTQAIQIAKAGASGAEVSDLLLVESFQVRERGPLTVWQVQLTGSDGSRAPAIIDATTGEILDTRQGNGSSFVSSVLPAEGTVSKAAEIQVNFTREMNPGTLNREAIQILEAKHSRTVTDDYWFEYHDRMLILRPVNPDFGFGSDNTVTVTIKGTVQDATGQPMGKDFSWSFRT